MKRPLCLPMQIGLLVFTPVLCQANLLTNGNLDSLTQIGNPELYYPTPTGWTLFTDPCSSDPCSIVRYPAFPASFADRLNPGGGNGVVFNPSEGNFPGFPDVLTVDAYLTQTVSGTPGLQYTMTGWAYFEGGYAGGVDTLNPLSPSTRPGLPSLTDTYFAMEFLDAGDNPLPGSVSIELKAAGQVNNPDPTEATRNWMQHALVGVAPAGTVSVRVTAAMLNGEYNIDLPHQSAWFDDFDLVAASPVPEPSTWLLGVLSLAAIGATRRIRR